MKKENSSTNKKKETLGQIKTDAQGKAPKKKGPGRKSNEQLAQEKAARDQEMLEGMPDEKAFEGLLTYAFQLLADRMGPHWILTDAEKESGSVLIHKVATKYFPLVGEYGPEVALLVWAGSVVLVRMQITAAFLKMSKDPDPEKDEIKDPEKKEK